MNGVGEVFHVSRELALRESPEELENLRQIQNVFGITKEYRTCQKTRRKCFKAAVEACEKDEWGKVSLASALGLRTLMPKSVFVHYVKKGNREKVAGIIKNKLLFQLAAQEECDLAMHVAARKGHNELLELLTQNAICTVHKKDSTGATSLHHAIKNGYSESVRKLIRLGADPRVSCCVDDNLYFAAFGLAVYKGQIDCGDALVASYPELDFSYEV